MYYLYIIKQISRPKVYVGQTNNPYNRWISHKSCVKKRNKTQYVHCVMIKYGINDFEFKIIASCRTREDADYIEMLLIKQYNSLATKGGLNIKPGGNTITHSPETIEKNAVSKYW